jgi:hypothetical protein
MSLKKFRTRFIYDEKTAKAKVEKAKRIFYQLEDRYKKFVKNAEG